MREDDHALLVYDLGRGWPPSASLEESRGENRREEEERGWPTRASLER